MSLHERQEAKHRELKDHTQSLQPRLCSDMEPADLVASVKMVLSPDDEKDPWVHDDLLFNAPFAQTLFDSFDVGMYAELNGAERVRLTFESERWPDGVVTFQDHQENVEVTAALRPGRKRGDEFRADHSRYGDGGPQNWRKISDAVPGMLREAISKKTKKLYSEPSVLVVRLEVPDYGTTTKVIESHIRECRFDPASRFTGIYVLWNNRLYQLERESTSPPVGTSRKYRASAESVRDRV